MTGLERFTALLKGDPVDKLPLRVGNYNVFLTDYYPLSVEQYLEDPDLNAEYFVKLVEEFELDSVKACLGYIFYGCGPEMGPLWQFPEDNFPAAVKGVIETRADVAKVAVPAEPGGYFAKFLQVNRLVKAAIGRKNHLGVSILGPFSAASFLRGFQDLLMDMIVDQDFFLEVLKKGEEVSLFIGRHCLDLKLHWANLLEIFLVPGLINPETFHQHLGPAADRVRLQLSSPPISNYLAVFMGRPGDSESQKDGQKIFDYYFGTAGSLEVIKTAAKYMMPGFPRLVSLSGNALVHWPRDRIVDFLRQGVDYFVHERGETPCIFLASLQSEGPEQAREVAEKLRAINRFREEYRLP